MQLPITFFVAIASALTATATPITSKRTCNVTPPTGPLPRTIAVSKVSSPPSSSPAEVSFAIPDNVVGPCSLTVKFPAGYPISQTGQSQLNFIALDGPATGSIVGTATLTPGGSATINSFSCRPSIGFRLEIAGEQGSVRYKQTTSAGLFMTYNC